MTAQRDRATSLKVLDAGHGMVAALVAKMMRELGATVARVEAEDGDPFYDFYPAYAAWHEGSKLIGPAEVGRHLAEADVLIVGGEDFPGASWPDADPKIAAANSGLITLRIGGMLAGRESEVPSVDILVQAATGFVNEQFTARPIYFAFGGPSYGAAITGLIGLWSALLERQRSGRGQTIDASMEQGLGLFWPQIWMTARDTSEAFENFSPRDVRHLIFETADGKHVHFTMGVPGAVAKLYGVLGIDADVDPEDRGAMSMARGVRNFFGDRDLIEPAVLKWNRDDLLQAMWNVGMTVEAVRDPGECVADEQVTANGFMKRTAAGDTVVACPLRIAAVCAPEAAPPRLAATTPNDARPVLEDVKVVDFGNFVAGPYGSRLLADLGADVIKVEPLTGLHHVTGLRNVWVSNRGKRSICIDAKHPAGAEIIRRLVARTDASQHNFRAGVATRLGVDPTSLRVVNPDIVSLETMSYGSRGPKAHLPGFDMGMQALSGHEVRAGGRGNIPLWYRSPFLDYGTGGLGAVAMLFGLYMRNETGCSMELENSLLASGLYFLSEIVVGPDGEVAGVPLLDRDMTGFNAWERLYQTKDGWIAVSARTDAMAQSLAKVAGLGDKVGPRTEWSDETGARLQSAFIAMTSERLLDALANAGVWAACCAGETWPRLREDSAAIDAGMVVDVPDPRYGRVKAIGSLVNFSRSAVGSAGKAAPYAPEPGQHTRQILGELGYGEDEINSFYAERAVA